MKLRKDQRRRRIQELTYLCKQAADRGDELGCWMYAAMVEELGGGLPVEQSTRQVETARMAGR